MTNNSPQHPRNINSFFSPSVLGMGAALLLLAGITVLLYSREALTEYSVDKQPLTVSTVVYHFQEQYRRDVSYLGLVAAARKTDLSFEISGRLNFLPVRQGSSVRQGQVIAEMDSSSLKAQRSIVLADIKRVKAQLKLAHIKVSRRQELRATGAVSKETFDETTLQAETLSAELEIASAQLEMIEINLQRSQIRAPYNGIVADLYLHEGAVVNPSHPVMKLVEASQQEAHIGVPVARAAALKIGDEYSLMLRDKEVRSRLLSVRPDVDSVTRSTIAVFSMLPGYSAFDGEPVTLLLSEEVRVAGGWLPITALIEGDRGLWTVFRVDGDAEKFVLREAVEVLDVQRARAYVRGTIQDSAEVVSIGVHRITPESSVLVEGE